MECRILISILWKNENILVVCIRQQLFIFAVPFDFVFDMANESLEEKQK